ncbi:MAG: hypothetical protein COA79_21240 [Planctomycetota bacterium]|nr:MAG: hypothetical protein COA79_21240 [Planctomycetota bacterium]
MALKKSKTKKFLSWLLLVTSVFIIFYIYGIPLVLKHYLPQIINNKFKNMEFVVECEEVTMSSLTTFQLQKVHIDASLLPDEYKEISIGQIEIKFNFYDYFINEGALIDEVIISNILLDNFIELKLPFEFKITGFGTHEYLLNLRGELAGELKLKKIRNLSWQIDIRDMNENSNQDIWQFSGVLEQAKKGKIKIETEMMFPFTNINLTWDRLNINKIWPSSYSEFIDEFCDGKVSLKGNLDNLNKFFQISDANLSKDLNGYADIKMYQMKGYHEIVKSHLTMQYEENIFESQFEYIVDEGKAFNSTFSISKSNYLFGNFNGSVKDFQNFSDMTLLNKIDLSGELKIKGNVGGTIDVPEVELNLFSKNLFYGKTKINFNLQSYIKGNYVRIPKCILESPNKLLKVESEFKLDDTSNFKIKVNDFIFGEKKQPYSLNKPIEILINKSKVFLYTFQFSSKKTSIGGYINLLDKGLGSLELSLNNLRIKEFCDFFNLPLIYNIDGDTNAKINISGSLMDPRLTLIGNISNLKVHEIPGGVSEFEIKVDSKGVEIISFDLNHKIENSRFHLDGYIPIVYDPSNLSIVEDTHRERSFYTICHNASPKFLSGILPKVESLEGKLTGKLNSYKIREKRYFSGRLKIVDGGVSFKTNLSPLTEINGSINFQRKKIIISDMTAKMGQGVLNLNGELILSDLVVDSLNLSFKGTKLKVINDEDLLLILSPEVTYTGSIDNPLLKGSVYIDMVKYDDNPQNLGDKINTFRNPTTEFDIWPRTELDLNFRCDHNAFNTIKQSSFFLQGSGKLSIKGYVANSEINGYVRIEKGRVPIYSKEFIVQGGIIRLDNDMPPFINFSADYKSNNIDIKMKINQYADESININYSSIPALTENDLQRFLVNNLLPGQEGEGIDLLSFVKASLDYSDVLSTQGLQWLKRFTFETRTRNRNGQEEFGIAVEYIFDEPEWFSVKAIQDDNGIFNFFLVASFDFLGFSVDTNLYVIEDFEHLEPKQIGEILLKLKTYKKGLVVVREKNEFDIQYMIRKLNHLVHINNLEESFNVEANHPLRVDYLKVVKDKKYKIDKSKKGLSIKSIRKFNRKIIDIVLSDLLANDQKKKRERKNKNVLNKRILGKGLKRKQRKTLRSLLIDEMTSYVETNKVSFLNHASFKIKRVCERWGYTYSSVKWEEIDNEFIGKGKTTPAVKFLIDLGPRFRFKKLFFSGVEKSLEPILISYTKFKPSKPTVPVYYSSSYSEYLSKQVRGYYLKAGYLDVKTGIKINAINKSKRNVIVTLWVDKGKLYKVSKVEFYGNTNISKNKIFKAVLSKLKKFKIIEEKSNSFVGARCHSILLTKMKNYLLDFYKNLGYYNCKVKARVKHKYEFDNIKSFLPSIATKEFKVLLSEKSGVFSFAELYKSKSKTYSMNEYYRLFNQIVHSNSKRWKFIQNFSKAEGWNDPDIILLFRQVILDRDNNNEMLLVRKLWTELYSLPAYKENKNNHLDNDFIWQDITCSVEEGIQYKFGNVVYKPRYVKKFKTLKRIIKKQIKVNKGDVYNLKDIRESVKQLTKLGVFREVDYVEKIRDGKIDVEFILRENKSISLEIQTGYGEFDRVQAGIRAFDHNIFGTTRSVGIKGRASTKNWLLEPIFESRFAWGFRNQWIGIFETNISDEFTSFRSGFETNLIKSFDYGVNLSFGYKFESNTAKDVVEELNQEETGFVIFSGTQLKFSINEVDSFLLPHKGYFFRIGGESNFKALGSSFDFAKIELQFTQHLPISDRITFSLGARLGAMKLISGSDEIPLQVKFFSGGGNTVRGYEHNSLGPIIDNASIGGELRGIFNSEFRFPLTLTGKKQFGVFFFDGGFLEMSADDYDDMKWDSAIGIGYRYVSPIGPLRLDLGLGLNERLEEKEFFDLRYERGEIKNLYIGGYKARLHLSFGFAF